MRQSDIVSVVLIGLVGVVVAVFACNAILGDPDENYHNVTTIEVISSDLAEPSSEVFNPVAVNPTIEVYVGSCAEGNNSASCDVEFVDTEDSESGAGDTGSSQDQNQTR